MERIDFQVDCISCIVKRKDTQTENWVGYIGFTEYQFDNYVDSNNYFNLDSLHDSIGMSLTYDKDPLSILENSQDTETTKWLVLTSKETNSTCGNMITSVIALVLGLVVQK